MTSLNLNTINATPVTTLPRLNSDKAKVLFALLYYGVQSRNKLFQTSGCNGIHVRIHELRNDHFWPIFSVFGPEKRPDGEVVDVAFYHINWDRVSVDKALLDDFMLRAAALYL